MFQAKGIAVSALLSFFFIFLISLNYSALQIVKPTNATINSTNNTLNNIANSTFNESLKETVKIIDQVNSSAYIIFYPNLSSAYKYLQEAKNESSKNMLYALSLLNKSRENALLQEQLLNKNKTFTFIIILILTIITLIILYIIVVPNKHIIKQAQNRKNKN